MILRTPELNTLEVFTGWPQQHKVICTAATAVVPYSKEEILTVEQKIEKETASILAHINNTNFSGVGE